MRKSAYATLVLGMVVITFAYSNCAKPIPSIESSSIRPSSRSDSDTSNSNSELSDPSIIGSGSGGNTSPSPSPSPYPSSSLTQFKSVHQIPNRTRSNNNGAIVDTASTGFKSLLDPRLLASGTDRTTGKAILEGGYYMLDSTNQEVVSWLNDQSSYFRLNGRHPLLEVEKYKEFKIYIPKGSFFAGASGYLPQKTRFAVVLKVGQAPKRTTPLSQEEYRFDETRGSYQCGSIDNSANCPYVGFSNVGTISTNSTFSGATGEAFEKLLEGQEIIVGHQGGGSTAIIPTLRRTANSPLAQGVWIYGRILTADSVPQGPSYIFSVVSDPFQSWLQSATFQTNGDPN